MSTLKDTEDSVVWLTSPLPEVVLDRAVIREGFSELTETTVSFLHEDAELDIQDLLGKWFTVHVRAHDGKVRDFGGVVTSVERRGFHQGLSHFVAELRPKLWLLTLRRNCRIFQDQTALDIIDSVLSESGIVLYSKKVSRTPVNRPYCVQYRETDYDFIARLMEEEGFYFYHSFAEENTIEILVITDGGGGAHEQLDAERMRAKWPGLIVSKDSIGLKEEPEQITNWAAVRNVVSGKVCLQDYDFLKPQNELKSQKLEETTAASKNMEIYDYPGLLREDPGAHSAAMMNAEVARFKAWRGFTGLVRMAVGQTFMIKTSESEVAAEEDKEFLVTSATHYIQDVSSMGDAARDAALATERTTFPPDVTGYFGCSFTAMSKASTYARPRITPRPIIPGLQTAMVVGKAGEEIWTDQYGRIRVKFHWDRDGEANETASCWVRVATPWGGKDYGFQAIPRIGMEVIIQFEEGDPDRPICTGMLYNALQKPGYPCDANSTLTGIRTNSSKGGGGYSELSFIDEKEKEKVFFQSERDYEQVVKNNATVTIGAEHKDKGDYTRTVHNDVTETVTEGNQSLTIKKGSLTQTIEKDVTETLKTGNQTLTIEAGSLTHTVEADVIETVNSGDQKVTIKTGNQTTTVESGDITTEASKGKIDTIAKLGNVSIKASAGTVTIEAGQKIELKVGTSKITLDLTGITLEGMNIESKAQVTGTIEATILKVAGQATANFESPLTTVKGSGMLTLQGAMTMIN